MPPPNIRIADIEGLGMTPINKTSLIEKIQYHDNPNIDRSPPPSAKLSIRADDPQKCPPIFVGMLVGGAVLFLVLFTIGCVMVVCFEPGLYTSDQRDNDGLPGAGQVVKVETQVSIAWKGSRGRSSVIGITDHGVADRPV